MIRSPCCGLTSIQHVALDCSIVCALCFLDHEAAPVECRKFSLGRHVCNFGVNKVQVFILDCRELQSLSPVSAPSSAISCSNQDDMLFATKRRQVRALCYLNKYVRNMHTKTDPGASSKRLNYPKYIFSMMKRVCMLRAFLGQSFSTFPSASIDLPLDCCDLPAAPPELLTTCEHDQCLD